MNVLTTAMIGLACAAGAARADIINLRLEATTQFATINSGPFAGTQVGGNDA